jgi:alpha-L-rhamnosidase
VADGDGAQVRVQLASLTGLLLDVTVPSVTGHVDVPVPLDPYGEYEWRIATVHVDGSPSQWRTQRFETGPHDLADWHAGWIEVPTGHTVVAACDVAGVRSARLFVAAQGLVQIAVDGSRINEGRVDPSRTDATRALYRVFDVTDVLHDGRHELEILVGLGEWHRTGRPPRVLAQLMIEDADGLRRWIPVDESALVRTSILEAEVPLYLERQDGTRSSRVVAEAVAPLAADTDPGGTRLPPQQVRPDGSPLIRTHESIPARELTRIAGARQFDVGVNIAGRTRVTVTPAQAGSVVSVIHGEHLDAHGRVDTTNITMPFDNGRTRQVVERVLRGGASEDIEAIFAYHGFRYVEVRGVPEDSDVEVVARPLHSTLNDRGSFDSDSPLLLELHDRARRTALNTVHGVPEDCPTREQAAWTGDLAAAAEYHFAQFDDARFMQKWIGDLMTSQSPDGGIPGIAPHVGVRETPPDPVWGSALHRVVENHWLHIGDERLLRDALPALRQWAAYQLDKVDECGIVSRFPISYGHDWLALEQTPPELIHSAAVVDSLETIARLEDAAGDAAAAAAHFEQSRALRSAMRRRFWDPVGLTVANDSQGALAAALAARILTDDEAQSVVARLAGKVRARGMRVSTGFALTRVLIRVLADAGRSDVVYGCLAQPDEPGIGAMLHHGPGTFWENWWIDPTNTGTGSLDHLGLGAPFGAWLWERVVGVVPTAPGYRRFAVRPANLAEVSRVEATIDAPLGQIVVRQQRSAGTLRLDLFVPAGMVAEVHAADDALVHREVTAGWHSLELPGRTPQREPASSEGDWTGIPLWAQPPDESDALNLRTIADAQPGNGAAPTLELVDRLSCMPVPHAQFDEPVTRVTSTRIDILPSVIMHFETALRLGDAGFVYAYVDQCAPSSAVRSAPFVRLHLANGEVVTRRARSWPAGWNRVIVDVTPLTAAVVAMEIGLEQTDSTGAEALVPPEMAGAASFHLGPVGYSAHTPRW